jgi:hypothetical protein
MFFGRSQFFYILTTNVITVILPDIRLPTSLIAMEHIISIPVVSSGDLTALDALDTEPPEERDE